MAILDVAKLIAKNTALPGVDGRKPVEIAKQQPATTIRVNLQKITKPFNIIRRYKIKFCGLMPDGYLIKWRFPAGHPIIAPNYIAARCVIAIQNWARSQEGGKDETNKISAKIAMDFTVDKIGPVNQYESYLVTKYRVNRYRRKKREDRRDE